MVRSNHVDAIGESSGPMHANVLGIEKNLTQAYLTTP